MSDPFRLDRFVQAQAAAWPQAREELARGSKSSHWMWFVFPQVQGLGRSATAQQYAISGLDEARAYLAHPVLGPRLLEASRLAADADAVSVESLMGGIDALKLRSSMTLFHLASPDQTAFLDVLDRWFDGGLDERTVEILGV